jgi:hypothetical protein
VVVRRASAASASVVAVVPDVPPGFERIAPNLNRAGGSAFPSAKPKVECLAVSLLRGVFNSIRRCSSFISSITHWFCISLICLIVVLIYVPMDKCMPLASCGGFSVQS